MVLRINSTWWDGYHYDFDMATLIRSSGSGGPIR